MRGAPAWQGRRSVQHPSSGSTLRADPPSPTRGEGKGRGAAQTWSDCPSRSSQTPSALLSSRFWRCKRDHYPAIVHRL
ncbi:hypothetical protein EOC94_11485 [Mesorhizobium sp. M6A.T.Ce.TU.016.01.1.1]|nr:hypothetical protein EOC94_11485 [Mesorhizobium sp. M6A.T.Ce.TU.016.01.1.1]